MKWFKRRKPVDPGAGYIAQLNAEAAESKTKPRITSPPASQVGDIWSDGVSNKKYRWNGSEWQNLPDTNDPIPRRTN